MSLEGLKKIGIEIEQTGGEFMLTAPGGTKASGISSKELKELGEMLEGLTKGNGAKQLARSARIFGGVGSVTLEAATRFGTALADLAKKYGIAFAADLAGAYLKMPIEALISENKRYT